MKSLWQKLSNIGLSADLSPQEVKRLRLTNQISASFSFIAFCYVFVFYFIGFHSEAYQVVAIVAGMAATMVFNNNKQYLLARYWFIAVLNIAVTLFSFYFGRKGGIHLTFFGLVCLPWLFFGIAEMKKLSIGLAITTACFYTFASSSGEAWLSIAPVIQHTLYLSMIGVTFVLVGLCLSFFALQSHIAEKTLADANEELEQQQEELRQTNEELHQQTESLRASEEELRVQEEELRQINAELEEKTEAIEIARRALSRKAEELETSSKYKSEFLANMSHELRTPLNSVLILATLLKENKLNNLNDKQIEYARIIHKSGTDLLNLINDILDLSKIEAGKIEINVEAVRVKDIARDMEDLFKVMAHEKGVAFSIEIEEDMPSEIRTDQQRLGQVIKNLLSNAFKFTEKGGTVALMFGKADKDVIISVKDTGIGIQQDKQQLIFEAFQQADGSTNRKYGGTGLGLSISKELIKRLGGTINLESAPGLGSIFRLKLPFDNQHSETGQAQEVMQQHTVQDFFDIKEQDTVPDDKSKLKAGEQPILIIEDDAQFASILQDFAHEKGYKTIIAIKGDEGLYYAKKYTPAAIILDLNLPVIDGRSLLKILKSEAPLSHIPVHIISADDRSNIREADIESYFHKPLQTNDLEHAFSNIEKNIRAKYRNILILSESKAINKSTLELLTAERQMAAAYDNVRTLNEAVKSLKDKSYDCLVVDIGKNIQHGLATLETLKESANGDIYMMVYLDTDLSAAEELQLRKYTRSFIRKSSHALDRITDEVSLFLHKIKNTKTVSVPAQYEKVSDKSLKDKKVLIADDDMRNIFALTAMLEEQGMTIIAAENGKEAIEQLANHPDTNIVLMDIMMPEMDGYDAMKFIRTNLRNTTIPIIALTAKAMAGDREKCIETGASDYITKPIDTNKLFSLMRVWLT